MTANRGSGRLQPLLPVLLFLLLASVVTFPMICTSGSFDRADTYFNTWMISWNCRAFTSLQNPLSPPVFQGFDDATGRFDLLLAQAFPAMPLRLAGVPPLRVHNLLFVLSLAFAGFAVFLLGSDLGLSRFGALFAGSAFVCLPFVQSHLWHLQLMSMGFTVLAIRSGLRYLGGEGRGWTVSLFVILQGMASLYYWYFSCLALGLMMVWGIFTCGKRRSAGLLAWTAAGCAALLPLLVPHLRNAETWSMDTVASTDVAALISPWENSLLAGWARPSFLVGEAAFWPGLAVAGGLAWWLIAGRRERRLKKASFLLLMASFFLLFSLGPTLTVFGRHVSRGFLRLLAPLPGISSIRLPGRAAFLFLLPAVLAAGTMLGRRKWLAVAGIVLCAAEVFPGALPMYPAERPPWFQWVGRVGPQRVVYLPMSTSMVRPERECGRLFGSIPDFVPMVNGYATGLPSLYPEVTEVLNGWPSPEADSLLDRMGVDCVIATDTVLQGADTVWTTGPRSSCAFIRR